MAGAGSLVFLAALLCAQLGASAPVPGRRLQQAPSPTPAQVPASGTAGLDMYGPSPSSAAQGEAEALKIFQQGSRNFMSLQASGLQGWADSSGAASNPCQGWTGVTCDENNHVTALELPDWNLETRLPPELSLLTYLQTLNLTGNNLVGGLPSNWGQSSVFESLRVLDLSRNPGLSGALPPVWGTQGAFPSLQALQLAWTGVSGQLPLAWGGQQSLPKLVTLDLSNNILAGNLPAAWGTMGAFESLKQLNLNNNSLSGTLPAQWGDTSNGAVLVSLQSLDVSTNSLSGALPATWGSGFAEMSVLSLHNNQLEGMLPSQWASEGQFLNLTYLDLHYNELYGVVPDSWNSWSILPDLTLILAPGNALCGMPSENLQNALMNLDNSDLPSCMAPVPALYQNIFPPNPAPAPLLQAPPPVPTPEPAAAPAPSPIASSIAPTPLLTVPIALEPSGQPTAAAMIPTTAPVPAPSPPVVAEMAVPIPAPATALASAPEVVLSTAPAPSPAAGGFQVPIPAPAPGPDSPAQVSARYVMSGPNLDQNNQTVRGILVSAMNNTLQLGSGMPVTLQSFASLASRRRLLAVQDSAQAIFIFNTTNREAPALVNQLNNTNTTSSFGEALSQQGLPNVEPRLNETSINSPLVTDPFAPNAAPSLLSPGPGVVPIAPSGETGSSALSGGAIAGIVVGAVIAILLAALLLFFCCYRRRQRSKASQNDAEKAGSEDSGSGYSLGQSPKASSGFFGGFRKQASPASPSKQSQASSQPRTPEAQKLSKRDGHGWNFVARALPWRSPVKTPTSPLSPGGSDRSSASGLSEHAAKAALKYKTASPASPLAEKQEFEGPGFNPVRIPESSSARTRANMDSLDSFEELEQGQIQTIPASLVEKRDNYERLRRQMELQQAEEEQEQELQRQRQLQKQQEVEKQEVPPDADKPADPPSELTTPSSGHDESTEGSSEGSAAQHGGRRFAEQVRSPEAPHPSPDTSSVSDKVPVGREVDHTPPSTSRWMRGGDMQAGEHTPASTTRFLRPGEQYPSSYSRRMVDESSRPRRPGTSRPFSPQASFDGHEKISKGGFVKRAVPEDRPPPPSYSRRQPEERTAKAPPAQPLPQEQAVSSLPASRQGSGAMSRRGSASLPSRADSLARTASGPSRTVSGDLKLHGRQGKGILRNSGDDTARLSDSDTGRLPPRAETPLSARSGSLSRSGSLQRVVSFEDELPIKDDLLTRGTYFSRSGGLADARNDLATVREVPNSETPETGAQEGGIQPATAQEVKPQPVRAQAAKGFVRQASQEPRFRTQAAEASRPTLGRQQKTMSSRLGSRELARELGLSQGGSEHHVRVRDPQPTGRSRSGKLENRRVPTPTGRAALEQREDKWEREAARLKMLEDHMRSGLGPRGRERGDAPPVRRHAEHSRPGQSARSSKPSLEEMLVLIEDARKLYPPGSETRVKLDQRAQDFSARLDLERQRHRTGRREKPESEIQPF